MPTERACPACGAPVQADTAFCGECDSLVSSAADHQPGSGASMLPPPITPSVQPTAPRDRMAPAEVLTCWQCDVSNPPSRTFCASCGAFIAVRSRTSSRPPASSTPGTGLPDRPAALDYPSALERPPTGPEAGGSELMSLGSYAVAMQRYERSSRRRVLLTMASLALAAVVGVSAIYVAMTRSDGGPDPNLAAAVPAASPAAAADQVQPELEAEAPPVQAEAPPVQAEAPPVQAVAPPTADGPTPDEAGSDSHEEPPPQVETPSVAEAEAEAEAEVPAEPVEAQPEELITAALTEDVAGEDATFPSEEFEPASNARSEPVRDLADPPAEPVETEPEEQIEWRDGWVCDGRFELEDPRGRSWSVSRVSFGEGRDNERVTLHMDRIGSDGSSILTAETFPSARVQRDVPGVRRPSVGRTTLVVHLSEGIRNNLGLKGYKPNGLESVKEFSVYQTLRGASRTLISTATDGCFRVRVPAWTGSSRAAQTQVIIDIKS